VRVRKDIPTKVLQFNVEDLSLRASTSLSFRAIKYPVFPVGVFCYLFKRESVARELKPTDELSKAYRHQIRTNP